MEFGLLGEVEVRVGGLVVDVGHARQQCVLAALLMDANRPVSVDVLVDRAWGARAPLRARNAVAGYVSRLRQALGETSASITRRPGGYVLTVDPLAVDVHRFHRLVERARVEPDALGEALALWRGEPFATLDTPWLASARAALEARRLAAVLDRNDFELARGRHGELLASVEEMSAEFPLDERLAGQLVLTLYRCGRQADALLRYEQVRLRLADELGADPCPALRLLHRRILTADPALNPAPNPALNLGLSPVLQPVRPGRVPRQLPAPPRSFVGRAGELAALDALLPDEPAEVVVAAVAGTAGAGKTALAVHWAHRVAARFPDGQLHVDLRGSAGVVTAPGEVIRGFLDALEVAPERIPAGLDARAGLLRSLLADRRMLIVLDDAQDADQVRPLLPGSPGCLVVVTSRNRLAGLVAIDAAHPVGLDELSTVESYDLLASRLGVRRLAAEPEATKEIITRCAGLPLALTVVAARIACTRLSLGEIAAELRDERVEAFDGGAATVFAWSHHALRDLDRCRTEV